MDKKTLFYLFVAFWGFVLSFAIFFVGYASIIGNAHMGPKDSYGWICKSVMPLFLNSTCEICYGRYSTIPTTLIGLVGMVYNGFLCYGLVMKKPKLIEIWMYFNIFSTIVLVITLVSYFFLTYARFISYLKCSNWCRISKFGWLFTFCYLDGANSIKILGAVLELPAWQQCQSSQFTSKMGQMGWIGSAV